MNRDKSEYYRILQVVGDEFIGVQGIVYSIVILTMIGKYKKRIKDYESTVSKTLINALYIGTSLNLLAWTIGFIGIQFKYLPFDVNVDFFTMTYLVMVVVIYVVSYFAIKSPEIFKLEESNIRVVYMKNPINILKKTGTGQAVKGLANEDAGTNGDISNPEMEDVNSRLIEYMKAEKPFLDPDLTLPELAKSLDISRNQLSNVINKKHGMNFYQFVNRYRVEEVKELMEDPANSNLKLISLAYDAGFNSKASFNRIFKQMTKMTPSEYYSRFKKAV
jgi:AraC-like DNA-binding protein